MTTTTGHAHGESGANTCCQAAPKMPAEKVVNGFVFSFFVICAFYGLFLSSIVGPLVLMTLGWEKALGATFITFGVGGLTCAVGFGKRTMKTIVVAYQESMS